MTHPEPVPELIFKVASRAVFDASVAAGSFVGMPIDAADGYLHFSTGSQLRETLRLYFAGQRDLALFTVATAPLGAVLRWEASRGGALFPHVYGPLGMADIVHLASIDVAADGAVSLPDWAQ